ncbi:MAG: 1-acyl-sn-glycerol-3-phosphate acyltransferase [Bacteroidales bacterium]|jgi:1-acyl-sn-glycerol-3-phosphate acyltransferase|nr:1-acyl-sn-glycerol-3-phosphate acyltransferase [Bacteroidales bacterium]
MIENTDRLKKKLSRYSKGYALVRGIVVHRVFSLFYRRIQVIGSENVPRKGAVIFTPNHQNSLMDAICILCTYNRQPVFVARADIFNKPFIIAILNFLRILPIYRKRDGVNTIDNNQETFDILLEVLHHQQAVGIMPEGVHNKIKRLRMLQKGVFRFAMKAQEHSGNQPDIKVVPVGLEYSDTRKFRSNVIVRYGSPIEMSDYYDLYVENAPRAFKLLQDTLSAKMKEGMVNIENEEYYQEIECARRFFEKETLQRLGLKSDGEGRLSAQQHIVADLEHLAAESPEKMRILCTDIKEYADLTDKYRFRDWVIARQPYSLAGLLLRSLLALLCFPVWIAGMAFNYLPYKLCAWSSRKVKDPQFVSSVQYVAALVAFPLYHLILAVLACIFVPCIWGKISIIVLLIPAGLVAFRWYLSVKKLIARYRFFFAKRGKNSDILKMISLRKSILEKML